MYISDQGAFQIFEGLQPFNSKVALATASRGESFDRKYQATFHLSVYAALRLCCFRIRSRDVSSHTVTSSFVPSAVSGVEFAILHVIRRTTASGLLPSDVKGFFLFRGMSDTFTESAAPPAGSQTHWLLAS